jgi:hypothetical protein
MSKSEHEQTFATGDECVLIVEGLSGDLRVSGWDKAELAVRASDGTPRVRQEGATFRVQAGVFNADDLEIRAPRACDVTLQSASGDLTARDIAGRVKLQTASGDIEAASLQGRLLAQSASGDLEIKASRLMEARLDTASGDITVESALDAQGEYKIHTASGDVRLLVPENQAATLYVQRRSGDFHCALPHTIQEENHHHLEVRVNGGGVAVRIESISGDVHVTAASTLPEAEEGERMAAPSHATKPLHQDEPPIAREPFAVDETPPAPAGWEAPADREAPAAEEPASVTAQRMAILKAIEEGRMTVSEGLVKLQALD